MATCALALPVVADNACGEGNVRLVYPNGLTIDDEGSLYICDIGTHQICKLNDDGQLAIVAGEGVEGFAGDGGEATAARLHAPHDIAWFKKTGVLYVADTFNHRIRRIDAAGGISTVAGNGRAAYEGDGGLATEASLNNPQGIAVGASGEIYVADTFNHVVRRIDLNGVIATVAGSAPGLAGDGRPAVEAQLNMPTDVDLDADGFLYISDAANSRIRRVGPDGIIVTLAGRGEGAGLGGAGFEGDGGPGGEAKLFSPAGIALGSSGVLYISDSGNNRIRALLYGAIVTIAGTGDAGFKEEDRALDSVLNTPQKVAIGKDRSIFVADRANHRVRMITADGGMTTVAGEGAPAEATSVSAHR